MKKISLCVYVASLFIVTETQACDCRPAGPITAEIHRYDAVFVGTIESKQQGFYRVKSNEGFKTIRSGSTVLVAYDSNHQCELDLEVGKKYLLFLNQGNGGGWTAPECSPSEEASKATKKVHLLRKIAKLKG